MKPTDPDDPDELLARALQGVEPLRGRTRVVARPPARTPVTATPAPSATRRFELVSRGESLEGMVVGLDRRLLRRLRDARPEAELDLHGMHADPARAAIDAFVERSYAAGQRTLLIVHGRGTHSRDGVSVLKREVVHALTEGAAAAHILAFTPAPNRLGGTGALLVLLARGRAAPAEGAR